VTALTAGAFRNRGWRGAIGLIAAYALVLQAFLAYSMASQAAAQGDGPYSGSFFIVCTSQDDAAAGHAGAPAKPVTHCPICILSASAAATLPDIARLPLSPPSPHFVSAARTPFILIAYASRPHSRGPPATA
jgi:hypothetical protein